MTEIAKIKIKTESHFSNFDRGENIFRVMTLWNSTYVYVCQPSRRGFPASKTIPSVRAGQYINVAPRFHCCSCMCVCLVKGGLKLQTQTCREATVDTVECGHGECRVTAFAQYLTKGYFPQGVWWMC